jgi:hypothetical protein
VIDIPQRLREVVGEGHPGGSAWLERLPELVEACLEEWDLTLGETFPSSFSYVARATRRDGMPAVLKLTLPEHEGAGEAEALRIWGGDGAVLLLESNRERSALLLELVEPGDALTARPIDEAFAVALDIARRLWRPLEDGHPFRPISDHFAEILPLVEEDYALVPDACDRSLLNEAVAVYAAPRDETWLIHGDLHRRTSGARRGSHGSRSTRAHPPASASTSSAGSSSTRRAPGRSRCPTARSSRGASTFSLVRAVSTASGSAIGRWPRA